MSPREPGASATHGTEGIPLVLVVDDDEDHAFMLEALLESDGYRVVTATSHAAARAILRERTIDVLVSDLSLGDGSALDLVADLGARRPRVAIVLSGFDTVDDIERSLGAGYDAHLAKPTPLDNLRDIIAQGLRRRASAIGLAKGVDAGIVEHSKRSAG